MPIATTDIELRLSAPAAGAGNTTAGTPGASLGGYASTTELSTTTLNNLLLDIAAAQNTGGQVDYQCVFVHNAHATLTATGVRVYVPAEVAGGASVAVGVDTTAASALGSSTAQALTVASATVAPSGVSFSTPTSDGSGLALGDLAPGQVRAFWVRRSISGAAALNGDGATIAVAFDKGA